MYLIRPLHRTQIPLHFRLIHIAHMFQRFFLDGYPLPIVLPLDHFRQRHKLLLFQRSHNRIARILRHLHQGISYSRPPFKNPRVFVYAYFRLEFLLFSVASSHELFCWDVVVVGAGEGGVLGVDA